MMAFDLEGVPTSEQEPLEVFRHCIWKVSLSYNASQGRDTIVGDLGTVRI